MPRIAYQPDLFGEPPLDRIINVASVPQRSPFRYPDGKTWLVPRIRQWFISRPKPALFIEPFAGGGIASLSIAAEELADFVIMAELDGEIAAVWKTIIYGDGPALANRILNFDLTPESLNKILSENTSMEADIAFQTILKNRTYHGGILAAGSGQIKNGENGKGIKSRWYPETLRRRILEIVDIRARLAFVEGDGVDILKQNTHRTDAMFFIDPPYTAAGKRAGRRLYKHFALDHDELFEITSRLAGDFLMTYDDAEGVRKLALDHGFDMELVAMKNTHHAQMSELLIGRNLVWARSDFASEVPTRKSKTS